MLIKIAGESLFLCNSKSALQFLILPSQQFQVIIYTGLISAAQNGQFDVIAELVDLFGNLFELGMGPGCVNNLGWFSVCSLLLMHGPCQGGTQEGQGFPSAGRTLHKSILFRVQTLDNLNTNKCTY